MSTCKVKNKDINDKVEIQNAGIAVRKLILNDIKKNTPKDMKNRDEYIDDMLESVLEYEKIPPLLSDTSPSKTITKSLHNNEKDVDMNVYDIERTSNGYKVMYIIDSTKKARVVYVPSTGMTKNAKYNMNDLNTAYRFFESKRIQEKKKISSHYQTIEEQKKELKQKTFEFNSHETGKIDYSKENATIIGAQLINDPTKMNEVFNDIKEADSIKLSKEHEDLLKKTMLSFTTRAKNIIPNMVQVIKKNADENAGRMVMNGKNKGVWVSVSSGSIIAGNDMPAAEMYVHELLHASVEFALKKHKDLLSTTISDVMDIYTEFLNVVREEDFMPTLENSIDRDMERQRAKERIEYLRRPDVGFNEFIAMSQTNPVVYKILKERVTARKKYDTPKSMWQKIMLLIEKIYDFMYQYVRGNTDGMDGVEAMSKYIAEIQNLNNISVAEIEEKNIVLEQVGEVINLLNNKGSKYLKQVVSKVSKTMNNKEEAKLNNMLNDYLEKVSKGDANAFDSLRVLSQVIAKWMASENIADIGAFETWMEEGPGKLLSGIGIELLKPSGDIQQLIRGIRNSDKYETLVERLGLMASKIEAEVESITTQQSLLIKGLFKKELSEQDSIRLTKGILDIELDGLLSKELGSDEKTRIKNTIEVLTNSEKLDNEIEETKAGLRVLIDNDGKSNFIINQAIGLGEKMVTGKDMIAQLTNSYIILGASTMSMKMKDIRNENNKASAKTIRAYIDKLATLNALKHTDVDIKETTASYLKNEPDAITGLMRYDIMARNEFKASEDYNNQYDILRVKGHHQKIKARYITPKVNLKKNKNKMTEIDYKEVGSLTYDNDYEVYFNTDYTQPGWVAEGMRATNDGQDINSFINIMKEDILEIEDIFDEKEIKKRSEKIKELLSEKTDIVEEEFMNMTNKDYIPKKIGMRPVLSVGSDGNIFITDMDISVKKQSVEDKIHAGNKVDVVIARTFSRAKDVYLTKKHNHKILDVIESDMAENYDPETGRGKNNNMKYIKIGPYEKNAYNKEIWDIIPRHMKVEIFKRFSSIKVTQIAKIADDLSISESSIMTDDIRDINSNLKKEYLKPFPDTEKILKLQNKMHRQLVSNLNQMLKKAGKTSKTIDIRKQLAEIQNQSPYIAVRENMIYHLFGNRELTLLKHSKNKAFNAIIKFLKKMDMLWKHIVKTAKVNIVIRDLPVLVWNVVSNFLLAIIQGRNPIDEFKMQMKGIREINKYRKDSAKLYELKIKMQAGTATKADENEAKKLTNAINQNSAKPLVDAGLYNSVTEDLTNKDLHAETYFDSTIDKYISKMPQGVKDAIDVLYITKNTQAFNGLLLAMQYGDFIARYSSYHNYVKHGMSKDAAIKKVLDNQINYNFNHGKILQWLNAHGLVLFTKFVEKIQRVLKNTTIEKPFNVLLTILGGGFILDKSPFGDSVFERDWSFIFHSPDEIFDILLEKPALVQILTNDY
jgi:hypothetical protein